MFKYAEGTEQNHELTQEEEEKETFEKKLLELRAQAYRRRILPR